MNIIVFNTALKTNAISKKLLEKHDVTVLIENSDAVNLSETIKKTAKKIICFSSSNECLSLLEKENLDVLDTRIFCISEDYLLDAAYLRSELGLRGLKPNIAHRFRDKTLMKSILLNNNIRAPKFGLFSSNITFEQIQGQVGTPFVLKPCGALGALGVVIINNKVEFEKFSLCMLDMEYQYEEFVSGKLYHVDMLLMDSEIIFQAACEYTAPNLEFQYGKSCLSMPLQTNSQLDISLKSFTKKCLNTLGLTDGPAHTEIFISDQGEMIFLESAARTPGALVVPLYKKQFKMNMIDLAFLVEVNDVSTINTLFQEEGDMRYFAGLFPTKAGVIEVLIHPNISSCYDLQLKYLVGDEMRNPLSLRDIGATIVAENNNYEILKTDFENLINFTPFKVTTN